MLILAFALAYLGMTLLCLTLNRHRTELLRADTWLPGAAVMRLLAVGCFGFALWLCINGQGGEIGAVIWLCLVMLSGLLLVMVQAWQSRWVLPLVPLLVVFGALQGLL